jgi:hypothetical protein
MDIHEDPEVGKAEKVTRFGCGALLGFIFGLYVVVKYSFESLDALWLSSLPPSVPADILR